MSLNEDAAKRELRSRIRQFINLGYEGPAEVADALLKNEEAWIMERIPAFVDYRTILREEASRQFMYLRQKADRGTAAQQRERKKRERESIIELGLDPDRASALTIMMARFEKTLEIYRDSVIADFVSDLLVKQALPDGTWKRRHDLTEADCLAIAESYEKRAATEAGQMHAFARFADVIREQGVSVLGEVNFSQLTGDARAA